VAQVGACRLHGAADIGYARAFRSLINAGISRSNHVPMVGCDGSILFSFYFALNDTGFFAIEIDLAFVIQQLHGFAGRPLGQYDGEADKQIGITNPGQPPEPGILVR
jgi:hypothetical protein